MAGITYRSAKKPLLQTRFLSHGTLEVSDIAASRRFYEEVLGLEVVQQAPMSLFIRLGGSHVYACVETKADRPEMPATGSRPDTRVVDGLAARQQDAAGGADARSHREISATSAGGPPRRPPIGSRGQLSKPLAEQHGRTPDGRDHRRHHGPG